MPNPAAHASIKSYLKAVTEEQLKAQANPKQAEPLFIGVLVTLCQVITDKLHSPGTDLFIFIFTLGTWPISSYTFSLVTGPLISRMSKPLKFYDAPTTKEYCLTMYSEKQSGLAIPAYLPSRGIRTLPFAL